MKDFIQKIQNSDEHTKKIWLFVFSAATMFFVIALWVLYVNVTIPTLAPVASAQTETKQDKGPGFFSIFAAGMKIIYDKAQQVIAREVATTNTIVIENPEQNFLLEGIPAVPPTKLTNH